MTWYIYIWLFILDNIEIVTSFPAVWLHNNWDYSLIKVDYKFHCWIKIVFLRI
jgi:hypothetical protein